MTALKIYNNLLKTTVTKVDLGAYYTPNKLSEWVSKLLLSYMKDKDKSIIDPASGDGSLLRPISNLCKNKLIAIDINSHELLKVKNSINDDNLLTTVALNTLNPSKKESTIEYWHKYFIKNNVGAIISNPPWGTNIWLTTEELKSNGFELAKGQYDSYELFLELMIKASPTNTILAFIIPDSIFLPEHKNLREFILKNSKIHVLARLGEGFFKNVHRGTCVLILEKYINTKEHKVQCFRLNKEERNNVLSQQINLDYLFDKKSHFVNQERFITDKNNLFDLDISEKDTAIQKIEKVKNLELSEYCNSGRGIEISKHGKVLFCSSCHTCYSIPKKDIQIECKCGYTINSFNTKKIISPIKTPTNYPLIVGEDIERYTCNITRYIEQEAKGINYKNKTIFQKEKLLIRKTGIGIQATIDKSKSYTNQVVFHYTLKEDITDTFLLKYILGVLSSRVMMAYYLKKYGDNEWRSHPYITQKIISQLPIPSIKSKKNYSLAKEISYHVEKILERPKDNYLIHDIAIEKLVIKLFSLSKRECKWVIQTLNDSQQLKPLRNIALKDYKILTSEKYEL